MLVRLCTRVHLDHTFPHQADIDITIQMSTSQRVAVLHEPQRSVLVYSIYHWSSNVPSHESSRTVLAFSSPHQGERPRSLIRRVRVPVQDAEAYGRRLVGDSMMGPCKLPTFLPFQQPDAIGTNGIPTCYLKPMAHM